MQVVRNINEDSSAEELQDWNGGKDACLVAGIKPEKFFLSIVFNTYSDLYFSEVRRADHLARKRRGSS